ncbi:hypothetical protein ASPTUDRAFT_47180 [Aspergillus tubingensis CBS 134.48]|uniref:Uncharacterized protein n=1 Tax=Aspergillus tubingensis (strain CBS 134.48) TaxID=767770 RepID=A0A1L9MSY8_ASPTC|nr:hypothetical protein ASPTUDRAFT_47180 [Aspergillus tubingensis CBS 134.48]
MFRPILRHKTLQPEMQTTNLACNAGEVTVYYRPVNPMAQDCCKRQKASLFTYLVPLAYYDNTKDPLIMDACNAVGPRELVRSVACLLPFLSRHSPRAHVLSRSQPVQCGSSVVFAGRLKPLVTGCGGDQAPPFMCVLPKWVNIKLPLRGGE